MRDAPANWGDAFARMPTQTPPPEAWRRVAARLEDHPREASRRLSHRVRAVGWVALAATLVAAVALPWQGLLAPAAGPSDAPPTGVASADAEAPTLAELHAESALLETLVAHARDGSVATGSAAAMASGLEAQLVAIDAALAAPGLDAAREHALWRERVQALQALAGFEGTRRWLAANGEQYDGVLVQVN